jgi:hypothetical protein
MSLAVFERDRSRRGLCDCHANAESACCGKSENCCPHFKRNARRPPTAARKSRECLPPGALSGDYVTYVKFRESLPLCLRVFHFWAVGADPPWRAPAALGSCQPNIQSHTLDRLVQDQTHATLLRLTKVGFRIGFN